MSAIDCRRPQKPSEASPVVAKNNNLLLSVLIGGFLSIIVLLAIVVGIGLALLFKVGGSSAKNKQVQQEVAQQQSTTKFSGDIVVIPNALPKNDKLGPKNGVAEKPPPVVLENPPQQGGPSPKTGPQATLKRAGSPGGPGEVIPGFVTRNR